MADQPRAYMVFHEDALGDQHVFMTENADRAVAAYDQVRYTQRNVMCNEALSELLQKRSKRTN